MLKSQSRGSVMTTVLKRRGGSRIEVTLEGIMRLWRQILSVATHCLGHKPRRGENSPKHRSSAGTCRNIRRGPMTRSTIPASSRPPLAGSGTIAVRSKESCRPASAPTGKFTVIQFGLTLICDWSMPIQLLAELRVALVKRGIVP